MVTPHNPTPTTPDPPAPPQGMTTREMADYCGCSVSKVTYYLQRRSIRPCGETTRGNNTSVPLYNLTPEMEEYLRCLTRHNTYLKQSDESRIADGWFTVLEVAQKWECCYNKALDILINSGAEDRWEGGLDHVGRHFFRIPERLCRSPKGHKTNQLKLDDWLDSVPNGPVKNMVLDERRWKRSVGRRVLVEAHGGVRIEAVLVSYNMIWFHVRKDNGCVVKYNTRKEARILTEAD